MAENVDQPKTKSNVKDLVAGNLKKQKESPQEQKTPLSDIYELWFRIISGKAKNFPRFPLNLITCKVNQLEKIWYLVEENKVCQEISDRMVASAIRDYSMEHFGGMELWAGTVSRSLDIAASVKSHLEETEKPYFFSFKSEDVYCFNKLDFDSVPSSIEDVPVFAEILGRLTNKEAFVRYIGSLFFEKSNRQQYLWVFGEGQNGKGSLTRFLAKIFGRSYISLEPRPTGDGGRFWSHQLLDSRVGVFEDNNATSFVTSSWFKSLTGDDQVPMEIKGGARFSAKIKTKFIIMSNEKPRLSSEKADMRRIIFCELGALSSEPALDYESKLWAEASKIIGYCVDEYMRFAQGAGGHDFIPADIASAEDLASEEDDRFEYIFDSCFDNSSPTFECTAMEFGLLMTQHFGTSGSHYGLEGKFRRWVERTKGVKKKTVKRDGKSVKIYAGIKRKLVNNYTDTVTAGYR